MKKYFKKIKYYIHIYRMILIQDLKTKMSFRADFLISSFSGIMLNVASFISIWIMFQNFSSIMNWNYYEMLFLYGFSLLALTPQLVFFDNSWVLCDKVFKGDFITYCFRPINIFFYYTFEKININEIGQFFIGVTLVTYSWIKLGLDVNIIIVFKLIISLLTASLFMTAVVIFISSMSFWIINAKGLMDFFSKFKDYTRYPFTIFNNFFKFIFSFIIPIGFVAYYPSLFFIHTEELSWISFFGMFYGIILLYFSYKVWMKGALQYSGTGS